MKLIAGLGNPGIKYEKTRHNVGFLAVDYIRENSDIDFSNWKTDKLSQSLVSTAFLDGEKVILAKPQTYMNNSGNCVSSLTNTFNVKHEDITVIHDDVDIEFGKTKQQINRGSAGHNGVKSIIEHLKTKDFHRIRIGVFPADMDKEQVDIQKFVLKQFTKDELETLNAKIFPKILPQIL